MYSFCAFITKQVLQSVLITLQICIVLKQSPHKSKWLNMITEVHYKFDKRVVVYCIMNAQYCVFLDPETRRCFNQCTTMTHWVTLSRTSLLCSLSLIFLKNFLVQYFQDLLYSNLTAHGIEDVTYKLCFIIL